MPRPAPKRNRWTKGPKATNATKTSDQNETTTKSPSVERGTALDPRQALRSQTPLSRSHEQAIESSPTGDRPDTGSRPPTRSRGYSSTLSFAGRKGDMSSRIPGTPGYESSVLSNFRRRPRQQSILQMMQAEDGSSDLDDDDFLGGLSPQDESTPLNLTRGKSLLVRPAEQSEPPSEPESISSEGSRKRKRVEEIQMSQSPSQVTQNVDQISPSVTPRPRNPSSSKSQETPEPVQSPGGFSQTMAPPASSSPQWSPQGSITVPVRSPLVIPRQVSESKRPKHSTHLSTAILQDKLLPRRRQRRRKHRPADGLEPPSDESDDGMHDAASSDDDELSYLPLRRRRRAADSSKPRPLGNARGESKLNYQKEKRARGATAPASALKLSGPQEPATYSRTHQSGEIEQENELLLSSPSSSPLSSPPDSDLSGSDAETVSGHRYISEELRAAARKFAEVDKWEMEFEEVSASETQGSPAR
ncbi:uncharacterized protein N7459_002123 [Penicillium hispanicum]|uniref:uncharacterized protein n=1 Tax=Penicillium hispanicum TaxID=1080232 RepID=UPI00253F6BBD|nr:uncharacterized protein N7459_002123 [Penicillium hispanicum]KAJ5591754.1 hypothetical protein N7459_002123 [Penicillium hispanicum]